MTRSSDAKPYSRRKFLQNTTVTGVTLLLGPTVKGARNETFLLKPDQILSQLRKESGTTPLPDATWYIAEKSGDGLLYHIDPGILAEMQYLTFDLLLDGHEMCTFRVTLQEGANGPSFGFRTKPPVDPDNAQAGLLVTETNLVEALKQKSYTRFQWTSPK